MLTILTKSGHWIASLSPMTTYLYVEDPVTCDLKRSQQSSAIALLAYEKAKTDEGEKERRYEAKTLNAMRRAQTCPRQNEPIHDGAAISFPNMRLSSMFRLA